MRRTGALWLAVLLATAMFGQVDSAAASLYARSGVGTNTSGYMLYGTGNYARIYIYPNAVVAGSHKVSSIYLDRGDLASYVEAGFQTVQLTDGTEWTYAFTVYQSNWWPYSKVVAPVYPAAGTYPDTDIVVSGSDVKVYFNQTVYKTWPDASITTGRGVWGVERNSLSDSGNASFRYCQYKTSSGWIYWPYGAVYSDGQNNDPEVHFVASDIPGTHWAHFDY